MTRNNTPEATFLRADGSIGEIFPGQRIGDAFPGNPDTPLIGTPLVPGQKTIQGVDLPGGVGFVRAPEGMVPTLGPDGKMVFTTPEQANAMADRRFGTSPSAGGTTGSATATGAATAGGTDGFTAPTRAGSRAGQFFDDVKAFARQGISGAGGIYEYFTDPNQPTLESIFGRRDEYLRSAREADERARTGSVPLGEEGSIQRNFANRMATGEPLTKAEEAAALEFARFNNLNFDPRVGYSRGRMATAPQVTEISSSRQLMSGVPGGGSNMVRGPVMLPSGSGANLPTLSSVNAMAGMAPQGFPALSAYEQASMEQYARIAERSILPGETLTERDTRIAQSRTQGSGRGGLSQADARDLAQGMATDATEGEKMRALQIQSRLGLGRFGQGGSGADKLSQATSTVDRMIQNGQLSPDKRNAAIQRIMGLGDVGGVTGPGIIGSAEFDRVASQLQPGGSLYEMGIRVDPTQTDPYKMVYREKPGFEIGPPAREMVSPQLIQQLLPYLRSVRQPNTRDFAGVGMQVNQFAGSR